MAKLVPQKKTFDYVTQLDTIGTWLIWLIFLMSVIPLFVTKKETQWVLDLVEWLLLIFIPLEFILSIINSHYLA
jgi:L-asparagine transporter-like permease